MTLTEEQQIVTETLLTVLARYPQSRILLWATLFILQAIGIPQKVVAAWFACSTRNVRYINQQVRSICRGDGKTGRPPKSQAPPLDAEPAVIGYSAYAGLWLLVPGLLASRLLPLTHWLTFAVPVAGLLPWQWVLTVLVLAWLGFSRMQHLRDLWDVGVALFTGRCRVLDADRGRKALKAIPATAGQRFYQATAQTEGETIPQVQPRVSGDEHPVGHQGGPEMPKAKVPRFGRVRCAHHLFGTFVLGVRRFVGLVVTQANRRLCPGAADQLAEARAHQAQAQPGSSGLRAILDRGSYQGAAHRALQALRQQGVQHLALARRTQPNVAYWDSLVCTGQLELHPYVHHHDLALPPEQRRDHFFEEDPKAKYVATFFGSLDLPPGVQAQVYPSRQEHELAYRDLIHALGFDAQRVSHTTSRPAIGRSGARDGAGHPEHFSAQLAAHAGLQSRDLVSGSLASKVSASECGDSGPQVSAKARGALAPRGLPGGTSGPLLGSGCLEGVPGLGESSAVGHSLAKRVSAAHGDR